MKNWSKRRAMYRVYTRSSAYSDGGEIGDLHSAERLVSLVDLSIDTTSLSPDCSSPIGYDASIRRASRPMDQLESVGPRAHENPMPVAR